MPESQLDRFLMRIKMGYPSHETEKEILRKRVGDNPLDSLDPIADVSDVLAMQEAVAHVKVDSSLHDYALEIVNRTRKRSEEHTSELQSLTNLVCRLLLEKKKHNTSK